MISQSLKSFWLRINFGASKRADYYEYLALLMQGTSGRKTLRDIFSDDAARYTDTRGKLSALWLKKYEEKGGNLAETFRGTLPDQDLALIIVGQKAGGGALETSLYDLAKVTRLVAQAWNSFSTTIAVGLITVFFLLLALVAMPVFTVPRLRSVFNVDPVFLGPSTTKLYGFADWLSDNGFWLVLGFLGVAYLLFYSVHNLTGRVRGVLDNYLIWRLYRDIQGIRFMITLATVLRQRGNISTQLRAGIQMQRNSVSPWLRSHIDMMLERIDAGKIGHETFDTGLLEKEMLNFLSDFVLATGLDQGLSKTSEVIKVRTMKKVERRALVLRWFLVLSSVGCLIFIAGLHFSTIFEMKDALSSSLSAR